MSAETSADSKPAGFSAPDIPSESILNTCIKCGLCLPTCPTYRLTLDERSSPRGRIHLIKEVLEGTLPPDDATFRMQMGECLGCRTCEPVCPSGVRFGEVLVDARAQIARARARTFGGVVAKIAFDVPLFDVRRLHALARLVRAYERSGLRAIIRRNGVLELFGLARLESLVPMPRGMPFVPNGAMWRTGNASRRGRCALFSGCVMSAMFGDVHRSTIRVLTRNGWDVEAPAGQGCCGALHLHAGYKDTARRLARRTIEAFERTKADAIIVNASGCGAAMKDFGRLLHGDPQWATRADAFAARVRDVSELLAQQPLETQGLATLPMRVAFQDPCHLAHAQGVTAQPRRLIDAIPGVERVEMANGGGCCGSAGVYNVTHPDAADRLADAMIDAALDAGAQRIVTANPGCHIQLAAVSSKREGPPVQHIMELLDEAYADDERRPPQQSRQGMALLAGAIVLGVVALLVLRRKR